MKLKNQFLILFGMMATTFLFIATAHSFDGAYIAGSFGGILPPVNHLGDKITDIVVSGSGYNIKDQWNSARKPSLNLTINAGFGKLFDKHYSGIEFGINKSRYRVKISKSITHNGWDASEELTLTLRDVDYSVDYKQGYLLSPKTMIFVKGGLVRTRARLCLISDAIVKFPADDMTFNHPGYLKNEKTIHPIRIGFGVEHKIRQNVSLTLDYTYTRKLGSFSLKGITSSTSPAATVTSHHSHKMTIQSTSIMFGLKTYF